MRALHDITLQIARGDFVAIMGGSGSTDTLIDILGYLGLPTPSGRSSSTASTVREIDDDDLADLRSRKIGFVSELQPRRPHGALANVGLPLAYARVDRRTRRERAQRALAEVGMAKRWHHQPSELSGGQQQRVAVAARWSTNPTMILADEPTGNLVRARPRRFYGSSRDSMPKAAPSC